VSRSLWGPVWAGRSTVGDPLHPGRGTDVPSTAGHHAVRHAHKAPGEGDMSQRLTPLPQDSLEPQKASAPPKTFCYMLPTTPQHLKTLNIEVKPVPVLHLTVCPTAAPGASLSRQTCPASAQLCSSSPAEGGEDLGGDQTQMQKCPSFP